MCESVCLRPMLLPRLLFLRWAGTTAQNCLKMASPRSSASFSSFSSCSCLLRGSSIYADMITRVCIRRHLRTSFTFNCSDDSSGRQDQDCSPRSCWRSRIHTGTTSVEYTFFSSYQSLPQLHGEEYQGPRRARWAALTHRPQ